MNHRLDTELAETKQMIAAQKLELGFQLKEKITSQEAELNHEWKDKIDVRKAELVLELKEMLATQQKAELDLVDHRQEERIK